MNLNDYGKQAASTLLKDHQYGDINAQLMAQVLGLVGESGEVAEKLKSLFEISKACSRLETERKL